MNTKIVIGKDIDGKSFEFDIKYMPHLLIAGITGSGKTKFLHSIICQLIENNSAEKIKFIMTDANRVDLVQYTNTPYSMTPTLTDMDRIPKLLDWLSYEQDRRLNDLVYAHVANIDEFNKKYNSTIFPRIILIINELADLMIINRFRIEKGLVSLTQLTKATGIHLIISTQCLTENVITGLIKENMPAKIAFKTTNSSNSKVIIDQIGAENLIGKGDMLFVPPDRNTPIKLQGNYISDNNLSTMLLRYNDMEPNYDSALFRYVFEKTSSDDTYDLDELFDQAVDIVKIAGKANTSLLQRKLSIGYARANRIIEQLVEKNIISKIDPITKVRNIIESI